MNRRKRGIGEMRRRKGDETDADAEKKRERRRREEDRQREREREREKEKEKERGREGKRDLSRGVPSGRRMGCVSQKACCSCSTMLRLD
jgi:hypothetical protein